MLWRIRWRAKRVKSDVRDGCKVEGMTQSAHERQGLMTANENQIVVYQPNETVRLDVRLENETVWLNRHQMATTLNFSWRNAKV